MSILEELEKAGQNVRVLDLRLKSIKIGLDNIEREIDILTTFEDRVMENIRELKKYYIVTIATEYKKAADDLGRAKTRLSFLRIDKDTHLKALSDTEKKLIDARSEYLRIHQKTSKNVIKVNFRSKNVRQK